MPPNISIILPIQMQPTLPVILPIETPPSLPVILNIKIPARLPLIMHPQTPPSLPACHSALTTAHTDPSQLAHKLPIERPPNLHLISYTCPQILPIEPPCRLN